MRGLLGLDAGCLAEAGQVIPLDCVGDSIGQFDLPGFIDAAVNPADHIQVDGVVGGVFVLIDVEPVHLSSSLVGTGVLPHVSKVLQTALPCQCKRQNFWHKVLAQGAI